MDLDQRAAELARAEIREPFWGTTRQFLAVHEIVEVGGVTEIARLDSTSAPGSCLVYFPVRNQGYFFVVRVGPGADGALEITYACWQERARVWLGIVGQELTPADVTLKTGLEPTETHLRGDVFLKGPTRYSANIWKLEPQAGVPGSLDEKLRVLLGCVGPHADRIRALKPSCDVEVGFAYESWRGDPQFGGWHIDADATQVLASLGAELDFDLYAFGPDMAED